MKIKVELGRIGIQRMKTGEMQPPSFFTLNSDNSHPVQKYKNLNVIINRCHSREETKETKIPYNYLILLMYLFLFFTSFFLSGEARDLYTNNASEF